MVLVKGAVGGAFNLASCRTTAHIGDSAMTFQNGNAANVIQAFNASGFQVGSSTAINANGPTYWYAAWGPGTSTVSAAAGIPSAAPSPFEFPDTPYAWYKMGLDMLQTYKSAKLR